MDAAPCCFGWEENPYDQVAWLVVSCLLVVIVVCSPCISVFDIISISYCAPVVVPVFEY
jgi:hypothetical protein